MVIAPERGKGRIAGDCAGRGLGEARDCGGTNALQFGAFTTWRQVAAFGVKAWETEAHSYDGDDLRIVENALTDAKPAAQAYARRVGIGTTRGMDTNPRRLAGDANARGGRDLEDGPWLMREGRAISGCVATHAASPDVFGQRGQRSATGVHGRGTIRARSADQRVGLR